METYYSKYNKRPKYLGTKKLLVFEQFDKLTSLSSKAIYQLTKERVTLVPSAQLKWNQIFPERSLIWKDL